LQDDVAVHCGNDPVDDVGGAGARADSEQQKPQDKG
jgi:hypothetical protein